MAVVTDSKGLEEPKDPASDNVFALYNLIGTAAQTAELRTKYLAGNFGYGHAKTALLELILDHFKNEREAYNHYMSDRTSLKAELKKEKTKRGQSELLFLIA